MLQKLCSQNAVKDLKWSYAKIEIGFGYRILTYFLLLSMKSWQVSAGSPVLLKVFFYLLWKFKLQEVLQVNIDFRLCARRRIGWLFCAIYDGFNGIDDTDCLACTLYKSTVFQLQLLDYQIKSHQDVDDGKKMNFIVPQG